MVTLNVYGSSFLSHLLNRFNWELLQMKVVKWLRKEGPVDAVCPIAARGGRSTTVALLHGAAASDQLEVVRELLKRGASVNLQTELGATALMDAAGRGHLSILRVLLQYSADPDLQANEGGTALMVRPPAEVKRRA